MNVELSGVLLACPVIGCMWLGRDLEPHLGEHSTAQWLGTVNQLRAATVQREQVWSEAILQRLGPATLADIRDTVKILLGWPR